MKKFFNRILVMVIFMATAFAVHAEDAYRLNPGDLLSISVWNEEALQKDLVILPDGSISFPLAGQLTAKDKTVLEVENELKENLSQYLADPIVTVSVNAVSGNTIHILGKVLNPGVFPMNQPLDAMQALSLAGGLNVFAEENNIIILRRKGDQQQIIPVYYARIKKGQALETNVLLESGDVMIIP